MTKIKKFNSVPGLKIDYRAALDQLRFMCLLHCIFSFGCGAIVLSVSPLAAVLCVIFSFINVHEFNEARLKLRDLDSETDQELAEWRDSVINHIP